VNSSTNKGNGVHLGMKIIKSFCLKHNNGGLEVLPPVPQDEPLFGNTVFANIVS
jgi:hypothetical protein